MRRAVLTLCALAAAAACNQPSAPPASATPAPAAKALGIRADGDTEIKPDLGQVPPELQKVYEHIDQNIDAHVENLQKWIRQPSISNSGEGIPESAEMVKGFFDVLGCQQSRVYEWNELQRRLTQGDRLPGHPEEDVRLAMGWR